MVVVNNSRNKLNSFEINDQNGDKQSNSMHYMYKSYWQCYTDFMRSPRTIFFYDTVQITFRLFFFFNNCCTTFVFARFVFIFICFSRFKFLYIGFLQLFSFFLLCDLGYHDAVQVNQPSHEWNGNYSAAASADPLMSPAATNIGNETKSGNVVGGHVELVRTVKHVSYIEYVLCFWVVCLILDEARQVTKWHCNYVECFLQYALTILIINSIRFEQYFNHDTKQSVKKTTRHYFSDGWNYFDIVGCVLFILAMFFRIVALYTNEMVLVAARIIFCIDLVVWYCRLLQVFLVLKSLGPKLLMIQKMAKDLLFFISFMIVFIVLFAVITHGKQAIRQTT